MELKQFNEIPVLETERLLLESLTVEDTTLLYKFNSNPKALEYIAREPYTELKQAEELFQKFSKGIEEKTMFWWKIKLKSGEVIGYCGLFDINSNVRKCEMGYGLLEEYWGKGYASEMAECLRKFGMEEMNLHRIYAVIDPKNKASIKVVEKMGFQFEGTNRHTEYARGKYFDLSVYALLK